MCHVLMDFPYSYAFVIGAKCSLILMSFKHTNDIGSKMCEKPGTKVNHKINNNFQINIWLMNDQIENKNRLKYSFLLFIVVDVVMHGILRVCIQLE